jgi:mRNA interferase RelE/StbE
VTWTVEVAPRAARDLAALGRAEQTRIRRYLAERRATEEDPRRLGHSLSGPLAGLWRYRVGNYRLICRIKDGRCVVLVLTVWHRREVDRRGPRHSSSAGSRVAPEKAAPSPP